jgi:hypothetical protein
MLTKYLDKTINEPEHLTRTIKVSCLSRFLHYSCTADRFVMALKAGLAPLHVIKFLQLDYFLALGQFNVANAAPVTAPQICKTRLIRFSAQACTATLI